MEIIAEVNQDESRFKFMKGRTEVILALTSILSVEEFNQLMKKAKAGTIRLKVIEK